MLKSSNGQAVPVKAKLLVNLVMDGKDRMAGEVIEMKARDFAYNNNLHRVERYVEPAKPEKKVKE